MSQPDRQVQVQVLRRGPAGAAARERVQDQVLGRQTAGTRTRRPRRLVRGTRLAPCGTLATIQFLSAGACSPPTMSGECFATIRTGSASPRNIRPPPAWSWSQTGACASAGRRSRTGSPGRQQLPVAEAHDDAVRPLLAELGLVLGVAGGRGQQRPGGQLQGLVQEAEGLVHRPRPRRPPCRAWACCASTAGRSRPPAPTPAPAWPATATRRLARCGRS